MASVIAHTLGKNAHERGKLLGSFHLVIDVSAKTQLPIPQRPFIYLPSSSRVEMSGDGAQVRRWYVAT